jgi:hypothetical protein
MWWWRSGLATSGPPSPSRLEENVSPVIIRTRLSRTLGCQTIIIANVADVSHQSPRNVLQNGKDVKMAHVADVDELYIGHVLQGGGGLSYSHYHGPFCFSPLGQRS